MPNDFLGLGRRPHGCNLVHAKNKSSLPHLPVVKQVGENKLEANEESPLSTAEIAIFPSAIVATATTPSSSSTSFAREESVLTRFWWPGLVYGKSTII